MNECWECSNTERALLYAEHHRSASLPERDEPNVPRQPRGSSDFTPIQPNQPVTWLIVTALTNQRQHSI